MPQINETFEDYLLKKYISPSSFKSEDVCTPAHFKANLEADHKATKATDYGSALHCKILTRKLYSNEFAELSLDKFGKGYKEKADGMPDLRDKFNKAVYEAFEKNNPNRTILDPGQTDMLRRMEANYYNCKGVTAFIDVTTCAIEQSLYFLAEFDDQDNFIQFVDLDYDSLTDESKKKYIQCKTRPDVINEPMRVGGDVKTSITANPKKFPKEILNYGYHIQAAMVMDAYFAVKGVRLEQFIFVVCEKQLPYLTIMYECEERMIQAGREEYIEKLTMIKKAMTSGEWLGYEMMADPEVLEDGTVVQNSSLLKIDLPPWYYKNREFKKRGEADALIDDFL